MIFKNTHRNIERVQKSKCSKKTESMQQKIISSGVKRRLKLLRIKLSVKEK